MGQENILELRHVSYIYPDGTKALNDLSLQVRRGKITALLGPNGAGKSTVFLHMNGLLRPAAGEVHFDGQPVSYTKKELHVLRKKVGIVFQDPEVQLFAPSVYQEVSIGPKNFGFSDAAAREAVRKALQTARIEFIQDKAPHHISYGQKKSVSIADILAVDPDVLIMDEPTVWLDPVRKNELIHLLKTLCAEGKTVLISTHDVDMAYSCAEEVYVIKDGIAIGGGPREEIFADAELLAEAELEQPWIVRMYFALLEMTEQFSHMRNTSLPATGEDLLNLVYSVIHGNLHGSNDEICE